MTPPGPEQRYQANIIELAHILGWTVAHFRPALTKHGWRTAVAADGAGFPDLFMVHPHLGTLHAEIKAAGKKVERPDQVAWRDLLVAAGARWHLWTEGTDLGLIAAELRDAAGTNTPPAGRWPLQDPQTSLLMESA